jgi:hypothetical protein
VDEKLKFSRSVRALDNAEPTSRRDVDGTSIADRPAADSLDNDFHTPDGSLVLGSRFRIEEGCSICHGW